jgi:hypothetical protein
MQRAMRTSRGSESACRDHLYEAVPILFAEELREKVGAARVGSSPTQQA